MLHKPWSITSKLVLVSLLSVVLSEHIIQVFDGEIGAGNSTFFTLKKEGRVTLIVDSAEGDADIFVSDDTMKPDFENYDLQSTTCGKDIVTIPISYKRPIGIAVVGHAYAPLTKYTMTVLMDYVENSSGASGLHSENDDQQEESVIWMIFVNVLKIIFEILL